MKKNDPNLTCYGCAHSIADQPFPSGPSGETPCLTCIRNHSSPDWWADANVPPDSVFMDQYIATDKLIQLKDTTQYPDYFCVNCGTQVWASKFTPHAQKSFCFQCWQKERDSEVQKEKDEDSVFRFLDL